MFEYDTDTVHDNGYGEHSANFWVDYDVDRFGQIKINQANVQCIDRDGGDMGGPEDVEDEDVFKYVSRQELLHHAQVSKLEQAIKHMAKKQARIFEHIEDYDLACVDCLKAIADGYTICGGCADEGA